MRGLTDSLLIGKDSGTPQAGHFSLGRENPVGKKSWKFGKGMSDYRVSEFIALQASTYTDLADAYGNLGKLYDGRYVAASPVEGGRHKKKRG